MHALHRQVEIAHNKNLKMCVHLVQENKAEQQQQKQQLEEWKSHIYMQWSLLGGW